MGYGSARRSNIQRDSNASPPPPYLSPRSKLRAWVLEVSAESQEVSTLLAELLPI